jgi:lipopolysaccharide transport system ATP-binding protein
MSVPAISVQQLSKRYRIGQRAAYHTLREALAKTARAPLRFLRRTHEEPAQIWALRDVSFDVRSGEALGIIGRNGAGKSPTKSVVISPHLQGVVDFTGGSARCWRWALVSITN